jgi:hypothetical protein
VDDDDAGVRQRGRAPRLQEEALLEVYALLLAGEARGADDLERHVPAEDGVVGPVDDAHGAPAQLGPDLVASDGAGSLAHARGRREAVA